MIRPLQDYVVLQKSTMTKSGIILMKDTVSSIAIVKAISDSLSTKAYSIGSEVIFDESKGIQITYEDEEYILIRDVYIVGVIE